LERIHSRRRMATSGRSRYPMVDYDNIDQQHRICRPLCSLKSS